MSSGPVDVRQIVGVLASEQRALLWAKVLVAEDGGDAMLAANLASAQRRDVRTLERAGLVVVSDGRVQPSLGAFQAALRGAASNELVDEGPERFFVNGVLESLPRRTKDRVEVLGHIAGQLFPASDGVLTERELMRHLSTIAEDPVGVRRALVDYGFVGREKDGARYWLAGRQ